MTWEFKLNQVFVIIVNKIYQLMVLPKNFGQDPTLLKTESVASRGHGHGPRVSERCTTGWMEDVLTEQRGLQTYSQLPNLVPASCRHSVGGCG